MEVSRTLVDRPFFSICIPQHNRTSFLIEVLKSLEKQTFRDFEVCISDDCSTDGREAEVIRFLEQSPLSFVYRKQERNGRYDKNLRASIALARGRFCFLLGNDDCLASDSTLEDIYADIQEFGSVGVVITSYENFATGRKFTRIQKRAILGSGPRVAASNFRNFSFVSGILLDTMKAKTHATAKWDGSEMYQMFIGCRIIAEGGLLLGLNRVTVREGVQIPGEQVHSYALKPRLNPCPIIERRLPMVMIGHLVVDALSPYQKPTDSEQIIQKIVLQLYFFTYPFWIVEYRRVQSWRYALGVCLGMRLRNVLDGLSISIGKRTRLLIVYALMSLGGLSVPIRLFNACQKHLYSVAKAFR